MSTNEEWDEIHGFVTPDEFARFQRWLAEQVASGELVEIPVSSSHGIPRVLEQRWYRATDGVIWRAVSPEPPFRGAFERVEK